MLGKTLFSCERPIPPSTGPPGRHFRGKDHPLRSSCRCLQECFNLPFVRLPVKPKTVADKFQTVQRIVGQAGDLALAVSGTDKVAVQVVAVEMLRSTAIHAYGPQMFGSNDANANSFLSLQCIDVLLSDPQVHLQQSQSQPPMSTT